MRGGLSVAGSLVVLCSVLLGSAAAPSAGAFAPRGGSVHGRGHGAVHGRRTRHRARRNALAAAYRHYDVGAYYFSGWAHGQNDNLSPLLTVKYRAYEPLIGWYDDSQGQVDKTIKQAASAGIDFFAFDWYDLARSPYPTDRALNDALGFYLTSKQRRKLKFCLNFIDFPPFMPRVRDWPALVNTWIRYFKQPGYLKVNGKPLFIIFSPWPMYSIFGSPLGVRLALDYLRARARAAGLPGVTIAVGEIVALHGNPIPIRWLGQEGYDVATGYNYHAMGGERYRVPVPYTTLRDENVAMWNRVAQQVPLPYIPVITSGWDQRFSAREQKTAIIYAGRTPRAFTCYAVQARHWVDTHAARTVKEHMVMIFAWNEIGEGGAIIPNHTYGYAYANAVRAVFGDARHAPSTPSYCH